MPWADDVGVGALVIARGNVAFGRRGCQDHHGDAPQGGVSLDDHEGFAAVRSGHVQVEQDDPGLVIAGAIRVAADTAQVLECLVAVGNKCQRVDDATVAMRHLGEQAIVRVVLDTQDAGRRGAPHPTDPLAWAPGAMPEA